MSDGDKSRFGGGTSAYEAILEKKRAALRQALRHEYLKTVYNPDLYGHDGKPVPFDTAMARWHALHATYEERYVPSVRNFAFVAVFIAIPILTHHYFLKKERIDKDRRFSSLETPYDHVERKLKWFV